MALPGTEFRTGETAPVSGEFVFDRHIAATTCKPTSEERVIPLNRGERFPPCKSCKTGVIWRLLRVVG